MGWIISTAVFLSGLNALLCFNIDPVAWKTLTQPAAGFGYQVVQRPSDLLVSAPLAQYSPTGRGLIYKCSTETCTQLSVPVAEFAVNMSLGLTMANDPSTQRTLACGQTIPKDCKSITMYSGTCWQIDASDRVTGPVPSSNGECGSADIVFLLDGSGSVNNQDFETMKTFVKNLVRSLLQADIKFAIVQFSSSPKIHFFFSDNLISGTASWERKVGEIRQLWGFTHTAKAIKSVVNDVFTPTKGSRPNVNKVLIVITDGESNDRIILPSATSLADNKKIVRFAIGVGGAFSSDQAKKELETIASTKENVFQVESFDALEQIRQTLQAKLFSIEGLQTSGKLLKFEMFQEEFSAPYVAEGNRMAIVGANEWKGGVVQYLSTGLQTGSYEAVIETDSYLGYSMAVAKTRSGTLTIIGAPRYQHRGAVMFQSGEYFGAVVCAMDLDLDSFTDLILISAPMFMDSHGEGKVYICSLTGSDVECRLDSPSVLRGDVSGKGRFGSSLAVLPDLNTDGLSDLAVGAPLENNGQGSIYIFHGEGGVGGISSSYSQRIAASEVQSPLRFFGLSISQSSFDHSGDGLPDLAIGSKGAVVLLRSKPIVMVEATVSFSPNRIPTQNSNCSKPLESTAEICFTMTRHSKVDKVTAKISYNLTLDATRKVPNNRAYFSEIQRETKGTVDIDLIRPVCNTVKFFVQACPEDALNALSNELMFSFEGLPNPPNPSASLALQAQKTTVHPARFLRSKYKDKEYSLITADVSTSTALPASTLIALSVSLVSVLAFS
ncbi:integrin alpha-X-like isoform X2 [Pungitius pungitius]|uniref:integrin alpha-X-like isoform X2 n=1 Tax=Pungitius pungitius TaxID=134920 RepID=UPI002E10CD80